MIFDRFECRPVLRPFPERRVGRQSQQQRKVSQHAIADVDRLVARVDSDVDVQPERDQPASDILHQFDQSEVAIVVRDFLVSPRRKRMCRPPKKFDAHSVEHVFDGFEFALQILPSISDGVADVGVDFDVALHQFRFDDAAEFFRQCCQHVFDSICQGE